MINLRVSKTEKDYLAGIAREAGLSLSAFLRMAAIKEAYKTLGTPKLVVANQQLRTDDGNV